ncbi:MAG: tRNA (N6-threonylcarbamoyladenosine(37)-N6)-methyltransferase TrmO [Proteobacteria bacterium]|nr:tRNA (N6-threonylcarbamoyladenosine(37)-N6)-methyltransferase TrmO [Pseudomonadota bacterium]
MEIILKPVGYARHSSESVPRHWSVSDVEGDLVLDPEYLPAMADIEAGSRIVVLFHFDRSEPFTPGHLRQTPPHKDRPMGVFSICSPVRPNPIGLSVLTVLGVAENVIRVRGLDLLDHTPILDIKPHIEAPA